MKKNVTGLVALACIVAFGLLGCLGSEAEEGPPLPPASSMKMDLSTFTTAQAAGALSPGKADGIGDKSNFNNAAGRVVWLNTAIVLALAPPATVFATAVSVDPVFENGDWIWDFSITNGANTYAALLRGFFDGGLKEGIHLNLEMKVTCTACKVPTDNYLWYTGRFNTDGNSGHWQFYNPEIVQEDQTFVKVEYEVTDEENKVLDFSNDRTDGHEDAGDRIEYKRTGEMARVSFHDESEMLDYMVEWNLSTDAGYIEVPGYNNGERACWGTDRKNVDCP